jgi:hypothetical protein
VHTWGPVWGTGFISRVCSRKDEFWGEGFGATKNVDGGNGLKVSSDEAFPPGEKLPIPVCFDS